MILLWSLLACHPKESVPDCMAGAPVLTSSAQTGAAIIRWSTAEASTSVVEWGVSELNRATRDDGVQSTEHAVMLVGAPADTEIRWRAVSNGPEGECASPESTYVVPAGEPAPAQLALVSADGPYSPGFRLLPLAGDPSVVVIVDDAGAVVWMWEPPKGLSPADAYLSADGTHVHILLLAEDIESGEGGVYDVALDGSSEVYSPLPYCHHAFIELADGRIAWLRANPREVDGYMVAGDDVVVSDADGTNASVLLTTWDIWTPDVPALLKGDNHYYKTWLDWTHLNSVHPRADGSLLISSHKLSTVLNVEPDGSVRWQMVGAQSPLVSDFTYSGDASLLFERQHNPQESADGGLLLFDNGEQRGEYSEAVEYAVDEGARTFTPRWSFDAGQRWVASRQGDVQRMPNGNTFVNWGSVGQLTEVTPEGDVAWELTVGELFLGFSEHHERIGGRVEE